MSEDLQKLAETAESAILAAAAIAERDAGRPLYHFRAPAQWMDDPNGIIFHEGMYHMMYSLNPHSAEHRAGMVYKTAVRVWDMHSKDWTGGITVWGHARSKDLVHWEHLPIAVYPSIGKGEHFVWFGCTVINDEGVPMAIYTAIGPEMRPEDSAEQWAALGSPDLMTWRPLPSNPLLTGSAHGATVIGEWRDPFVFKEAGRTFMVLGDAAAGNRWWRCMKPLIPVSPPGPIAALSSPIPAPPCPAPNAPISSGWETNGCCWCPPPRGGGVLRRRAGSGTV
ncbi:glycoside hydrolase family 32 protein [Acerihabitans sp. KWT182]|uniref:Glycoside hydrolase family 32 protein n=1 Tax=Acerihabitans sp. KWT182 TaxID=3157919 RepID=A0AAU7QH34_9GAMM